MKKTLLAFIILIFLTAVKTFAYYEAEARFGTFYETNTFYNNETPKSDIGFLVEPHLLYSTTGSSFYTIHTNSTVAYTKYLSNANQDNLSYDLNLKNNLRFSNKFQMYATPKAKLQSEPALSTTDKRLDRQTMGADFGMFYANDPRKQYLLDVSYELETLNQSAYEHLNNQSINAHLYYKKYFLPETYIYFGVSGGAKAFPDGRTVALGLRKYDSQRIEPGIGLEGRLTRYFKIRSYLAYSMITYAGVNRGNYADPVYLIELEEEMSPRDFLLMGLENMVEDSYFTNFQINQKIYVGYGKFIGDQILWVSKIDYLYRTYSRPNRRDDQRFVFETRMEYSYSQKLKLEGSFTFDILSSDGVNPASTIDPSSSYQNMRLGFFAKYLL